MKFPHLGKFGMVVLVAAVVGGLQLLDAYRASQNPPTVRQVISTVATVTPSTEDEITVENVEKTREPDSSIGFESFEADILGKDGIYWPFTDEPEFQPGMDRGLTILCYEKPDDPVREYRTGYPNGMPVGVECGFYRVGAYRFGPEQLVGISIMRPLPRPNDVP